MYPESIVSLNAQRVASRQIIAHSVFSRCSAVMLAGTSIDTRSSPKRSRDSFFRGVLLVLTWTTDLIRSDPNGDAFLIPVCKRSRTRGLSSDQVTHRRSVPI